MMHILALGIVLVAFPSLHLLIGMILSCLEKMTLITTPRGGWGSTALVHILARMLQKENGSLLQD